MADTPLDTPLPSAPAPADQTTTEDEAAAVVDVTEEFGGPKGAEPTRFGDWERNGRCSDF